MRAPIAVKLAVFASVLCYVASARSQIVDDLTCVYQKSTNTCVPKGCSLQNQTGDVTLDQSCRVNRTLEYRHEPQQLHLAFAGIEPGTGMTISWATEALEKAPAVWIGTSSATISQVKTAKIETRSYYQEGNYHLYNYHAVVTGLKPNTEYFYKVGSATDLGAQSTVTSFTTARSSGDKSPFVVAVYGDLGTDANAAASIKYINSLVGVFYEEIWNNFMNSLTTVMSRMAYMVAVGNHEAECHSEPCQESKNKQDQLGNYAAYNARFRMPAPESGGVLDMWYSFGFGSVHFTIISTETDYPGAPSNMYVTGRKYGGFGNQLLWLEADLKAADANRANVPWLVVCMHRSIYTLLMCDANGVPNDEALPVQKAFENLLIKYRVDVVLQAHTHAYERSFPTANSVPDMDGVSPDNKTYIEPKYPVYLTVGNPGNTEGLETFPNHPSPKWLAHMDNKHFGITKLSATPTKLTFTMIEAATEKVYDEFSIVK